MFAFRTVFVRGLVRFGVRTSQILLALALEPRSDFAIQLAAVSRMRRHRPKTIILIRISGRRVSEFFLRWLSLSSQDIRASPVTIVFRLLSSSRAFPQSGKLTASKWHLTRTPVPYLVHSALKSIMQGHVWAKTWQVQTAHPKASVAANQCRPPWSACCAGVAHGPPWPACYTSLGGPSLRSA